MKKHFTRREFFKKGLITSGALYSLVLETCSGSPQRNHLQKVSDKSRVVFARSDAVRNSDTLLHDTAVKNLLDNAIEQYFDIRPAKKVWSQLFSHSDIIGIKINCLAGKGISTSSELVDAIIESLLEAGIKKQNIIVWDRANKDLEKAGYKIQTSSRNVKYYGNDQAGFTNQIYESRSVGSLLSNILVNQCTAVINVPILKDHGIVGITNALKNFFGAIHNPNKYHINAGDPYIADLHLLPQLRNKIKLSICDLLTTQYEGGPPFMPQWIWHYNGLMIGTDLVALDACGWRLLEQKRSEKGLASLTSLGREPTYIVTAADAHHRLGTNDFDKIELVEI